jgi:methylated-DNA-[protein]-cysteine S-methyltransferase
MMKADKNYSVVIASPLGRLAVTLCNDKLAGIDFVSNRTPLQNPADGLSREVARQLDHYFKDSGFCFNLPLVPKGTDFQQKVWQVLQSVHCGSTDTYGGIAARLGSGARAVGNACRRNPLPIVIPCHRIVAASHIGGYAGHLDGQVHDRKCWLLAHEGYILPGGI